MHAKDWLQKGEKITASSRVLLMIHGRGGSAEDIVTLADHLPAKDFSIIAPRATNQTWYPFSFMAPVQQNEPWLSSALELLKDMVDEIAKTVSSENIFLLGFSQGACLTLEFAARNARRYGGIIAFTGGLVGREINESNYKGDFESTPVFIGSSDPDPHVPVARVRETETILKKQGAGVMVKIYPGMGHTINHDEIAEAAKILSV